MAWGGANVLVVVVVVELPLLVLQHLRVVRVNSLVKGGGGERGNGRDKGRVMARVRVQKG